MSEHDVVEVRVAELRRILHRYNNLNARILTRAEVALLSSDAAEHAAALRQICAAAEDLAEFTRATQRRLLGETG